jgi:hypothetical protein
MYFLLWKHGIFDFLLEWINFYIYVHDSRLSQLGTRINVSFASMIHSFIDP